MRVKHRSPALLLIGPGKKALGKFAGTD